MDTRTSHVRAPPHPRHFVPICSFGRPRSSSRAVFFRLFRRHRCLALGSNGLWQLDVPPRMHPSAVTAQALVQQPSFRTPRFSCWCAGSSAGAHSRCSGAQSRPPCGLRRSCSDLVSIARPNRTITSCVQAAPVGSSHGFAFASGRLFSWPSQDDNRGRVDGTTAAHAPAAQQVPILAAVCSCAQSRHVMCRLLRRSRWHLVLTARGHRTRAPASSLLRRQRSRCTLDGNVGTARS